MIYDPIKSKLKSVKTIRKRWRGGGVGGGTKQGSRELREVGK
jgi:hypothetical protein